jgi:hypothetical protein
VSSTAQRDKPTWSGGRRQWSLVFLGFFLVFAAWSFAAPYDAPPDEMMHAIRAAGVGSGQVAPTPERVQWNLGEGIGAVQQVPRGLASSAKCWALDPFTPATCARQISGGPVEDVPTSAGRYSPVYYFAVGLPLRLWPSWEGLVVARLISSALTAAMLAWGFVTLVRWSRHGLMLAALLAAATPMLAHLAGSVNPNGLEIAAGIGFFCGAIPLLLGRPDQARTSLVWLVGTSATLLATLRALGPLWLLAGLFALLIPQSMPHLRQLWRQRLVKWWTGVVLAGLVFAVLWTVLMKTGDTVPPSDGKFSRFGYAQAVLMYFSNWEIYLKGLVGVAGWFDIQMPGPFYWAWISAVAGLLIFALVAGGWADRWRFFVIFLGGVVAPGVMQVAQVKVTGFIIGGRYMMPLLVGIPLLAAFILERVMLNAKQSHSMTKLFCLILLPAHVALLVYSMVRWQKGLRVNPGPSYLNPLSGQWHPPTGSLLPVVAMLIGVLLVGWVFWRAPALAAALPVPGSLASAGDTASAPASRAERRAQANAEATTGPDVPDHVAAGS